MPSYLPDSLFGTGRGFYADSWPQQGHRNRRLLQRSLQTFVALSSGIHRWHDVGSAATDDHCRRAFGGLPSMTLTWEIKDYSFVTVSETSPDSQSIDLTLEAMGS